MLLKYVIALRGVDQNYEFYTWIYNIYVMARDAELHRFAISPEIINILS